MKYICIHGHFYQPPRENAWLEFVELQDSAQPWHDWNERINFECYAPNAAARILNNQGKIHKIVNNYAKLSFNFGPTLLSWMEQAVPDAYQGIITADQLSQERFGGHGSALAQVYNHLIMPLADPLDKETQVLWGIADFESRFKRKPEGMWLAETAADLASLEVMAKHGIKYTILAPRQAKAIKPPNQNQWANVDEGSIDTKRPYTVNLPSGKTIAVFFYDGTVAQEVAFKGLLNNGKNFAHRLMAQGDGRQESQLIHMATDGESYGHHHRFGEMALADCLNEIDQHPEFELINYGQYLEKFPPTFEAQIHDNSSWSCVHGVERWRSNCGCNTGGRGGWNQNWRAPLRAALDWVRDLLRPIYLEKMADLELDPWATRNDYIRILLDRSESNIEQFIHDHAGYDLNPDLRTMLLRCQEMQRNAQLMYTSCAWFFDEVSGLETNQVLQYALRALRYGELLSGGQYQEGFLEKLKNIPSNVYEDGSVSYLKNVIPTQLDLERVAKHVAMATVFSDSPTDLKLYNYQTKTIEFEKFRAGVQRLVMGKTSIKSSITLSEAEYYFCTLYMGQQHFIGHVSQELSSTDFENFKIHATRNFEAGNLGEVMGLMHDNFGHHHFSIWHLFKDEKVNILREITKRSLVQAESTFSDIYNDNYQLMNSMKQSNLPIATTFLEAARFVLNKDLREIIEADDINLYKLEDLIADLKKWNLEIQDLPEFLLAATERIFYEVKLIVHGGGNTEDIQELIKLIDILSVLDEDLNLWRAVNVYYAELKKLPDAKQDESWKTAFKELGEKLGVAIA